VHNEAVLSVLGDVAQQFCAVHLQRNLAKMVAKNNRSMCRNALSQIFKQRSLKAARAKLTEVHRALDRHTAR